MAGVKTRQSAVHGKSLVVGGSATFTKQDRLAQAAQQGDLAKVKKLLSKGVDPNFRNELTGLTALAVACEFNHVSILKMLLGAKATADVCGPQGVTPLIMAVQHDHVETIELLCAGGADVNQRAVEFPTEPRDASPLDVAARHNRARSLKVLLQHGAAINAVSAKNYSALTCAVINGSLACCKLLLDAKADPAVVASGPHGQLTIFDICALPHPLLTRDADQVNPCLMLLPGVPREEVADVRDRRGKAGGWTPEFFTWMVERRLVWADSVFDVAASNARRDEIGDTAWVLRCDAELSVLT